MLKLHLFEGNRPFFDSLKPSILFIHWAILYHTERQAKTMAIASLGHIEHDAHQQQKLTMCQQGNSCMPEQSSYQMGDTFLNLDTTGFLQKCWLLSGHMHYAQYPGVSN